jgi:hypothetical protein
MTPFANPADAVPYELVEFPKPQAARFVFEDFSQDLSSETSSVSSSSGKFVDFLNLKDLAEEKTTRVQLAVFQNFKDVLLPAKG